MPSSTPPPSGPPDPAALLALGLATQTTDASTHAAPPLTPAELASEFPQLEIIELLGRGGMGAVYKARQRDLDRLVALKILRPGLDADPGFAERFTREARALAQLNHPGIVTLYEFGKTSAGRYFILMEFVDGVNLRQLLAAGRLAPREALAIVPPLCDALQYAHDRGLIHRDIKPENILVDRLGRVKIADFGIARLASERSGERERPDSETNTLTSIGEIMGTPAYMAPEQRDRPAEVDHRADLYALGVVFYQMLTGELPAADQLRPPSTRVRLDVRLDEIVLRALEKDPTRRYATASELKTQVEQATTVLTRADDKPSKRPHHYLPSKWNKTFLVGTLLVVALGFFVAKSGISSLDDNRADPPSSHSAATNSSSAYESGPTKEVVLTQNGKKGGYDFDSGKVITVPAEKEPKGPDEAYRWNGKNGAETVINPNSTKPAVLVTGTAEVDINRDARAMRFDRAGDTMQTIVQRLRHDHGLRFSFENLDFTTADAVTLGARLRDLTDKETRGLLAGPEADQLRSARRLRDEEKLAPHTLIDLGAHYTRSIEGDTIPEFFEKLTAGTPYRAHKPGATWLIQPRGESRLTFPVTLKTAGMTVSEVIDAITKQAPHDRPIATGMVFAMPSTAGVDPTPWLSVQAPELEFDRTPAFEALCKLGEAARPGSVWELAGYRESRMLSTTPAPADEVLSVVNTTQAWLVGIDREGYAPAWRDASKTLRSTVTEENFIAAMLSVRTPLKRLKSADSVPPSH